MNREDIIRMAREAGLYHFYDSESHCTGITDARLVTEDKDRWDDRLVEMLAPFAHLVYESVFRDANIAASRTILDAAVLEEREACAGLAERRLLDDENADRRVGHHHACKSIAAAIRARGQV